MFVECERPSYTHTHTHTHVNTLAVAQDPWLPEPPRRRGRKGGRKGGRGAADVPDTEEEALPPPPPPPGVGASAPWLRDEVTLFGTVLAIIQSPMVGGCGGQEYFGSEEQGLCRVALCVAF